MIGGAPIGLLPIGAALSSEELGALVYCVVMVSSFVQGPIVVSSFSQGAAVMDSFRSGAIEHDHC